MCECCGCDPVCDVQEGASCGCAKFDDTKTEPDTCCTD